MTPSIRRRARIRLGALPAFAPALALVVALALGGADRARAAAPLPAVADFFGPISLTQPLLSPSGKYIAVLASAPGTGRRRLLIIDASDVHKINLAASISNADIEGVHWVNDERLVFGLGDERTSAFLDDRGGLFAVDRTGENLRTIVGMEDADVTGTLIKSHVLSSNHWLLRTLDDGSDDVIVLKGTWKNSDWTDMTPMRVDTRTGLTRQVIASPAPSRAMDWAVDGHGNALAALTFSGDKTALVVPEGDHWKTLNEFARYTSSENAVDLVDVGPDGSVYVTAGEASDAQTEALYKLDLQTGRPAGAALVSLKGFDFDGDLIPDLKTHRLAGVRYVSDAPGTAWFDPALAALQSEIDARLPGMINEIQPAACDCSTKVIVTASSDHQPAAFFLYDTASKTLTSFGAARPSIDARAMADTDFFRFKARDGLEIPVYVTKPAAKGPLPAVVLVHGGPNLRGRTWGFSSEAQFLASRGYAVIEPEFRGSTGYGDKLMHAGFKQWGLAMDDDLVDATRWAVARGVADPRRVCVMGASYGGYATLMALIKDPQVFRCGVAASAVTDIGLMFDIQWSDADDDWKGYGMPQRVGDPVKDAAQFEATSPLKQAARLKQPLLLAHGGVDARVPIEHAERLRAALLSSGKTNLEWIRYNEEGHGWSKPENRYDYYTRVEKFLDTQIGPGSVGK